MRPYSCVLLALLLLNVSVLGLRIRPVSSWTGTVYIRADGSVDPYDAPIEHDTQNITYTLSGSISGQIVIEKNYTMLDGAGFTVGDTNGVLRGIDISGTAGVTIQNMSITKAQVGIYGAVVGNVSLIGNNIMTNAEDGIMLQQVTGLTMFANNLTNNPTGLFLGPVYDSKIFHNNFVGNFNSHVMVYGNITWDDDYPSGGNYWDDYNGTDGDSDGIGDSPYIIDLNNQDRYPLMNLYNQSHFEPLPACYLTINQSTNGTTVPPPGTYNYTKGTTVTVLAVPDADYEVHWVLDGAPEGQTNPLHVVMNENHTLRAVFQRAPFTNAPVYIRANGTVEPSNAPIEIIGTTYFMVGNINSTTDGIIIEKDDIILHGAGFWLQGSSTDQSRGIVLAGRKNVTIRNMAVMTFAYGIDLDQTLSINLVDNYLERNYCEASSWSGDIRASESSGIAISSNRIVAQDWEIGIQFTDCNSSSVGGSILTEDGSADSGSMGVWIRNCSECIIRDNNLTGWGYGLTSFESSSNTVRGNRISYCFDAVYLSNSSRTNIEENRLVANSRMGIMLAWTGGSLVRGNEVCANLQSGVSLADGSNRNNITWNNIADNGWDGVSFAQGGFPGGEYCIVSDNNITDNGFCGVELAAECNFNTVCRNNITGNVEQGIFLANASNSTIAHNNIDGNGLVGIWLEEGSSHNSITKNIVTNSSSCCIYLQSASSYNTFTENNIRTSDYGVLAVNCTCNNLIRNMIGDIYRFDVAFSNSSSSCMIGNTFEQCSWRLDVSVTFSANCSDNLIYHNNFIDSLALVVNSTCAFDNGYPSGGNYWSMYSGSDLSNGPSQNLVGSDGIGDTEFYWVTADILLDRYPLMGLFSSFDAGEWSGTTLRINVISNSTISNFLVNTTGKTVSFNVTGADLTRGFCVITLPNAIAQTMWHGNFTLIIDGSPTEFRNWTDAENTYIYVSYSHSEHEIAVVPEFDPVIFAFWPAILSLTAIIAIVGRRTTKKR